VQSCIVKKASPPFTGCLKIREAETGLCGAGGRDQLADRAGHRISREERIAHRNRLSRVAGVGNLILKPTVGSHSSAEIIRLIKRQHIAARSEKRNLNPDVTIRPQYVAG